MDSLSKACTLALILLLILSSLFSICSLLSGLVQGVNSSPSFTISIVVSINEQSKTCVFGINPDSSVGYTSKYDSLASNPHSNANSDSSGLYAYFLFVNQSTLDFLRLQKYIVPYSEYTTWFLAVEIMNREGIVTLAWNDTSVASLTLENNMSKEVYANMNEVSSFSYNIFATIGTESDFLIVYHPTAATTSPTPNPTPTPSVPEFSWLTILPILLSIPIALAIVRKKTARKCLTPKR